MTDPAPPKARTHLEALGGRTVLESLVRELYDDLFEDPIVGFLFRGSDKDHIVRMQVEFTAALLGGPATYTGRPMPEAHAHLPLLAGHFDRRHLLLAKLLERRAVPASVRERWLAADAQLRTSVLKAGADARTRARDRKSVV